MKGISAAQRTHLSGASLLKLKNPLYKAAVEAVTLDELRRDLAGAGDITTSAFFSSTSQVTAKIIAKQAGVFAGRVEAEYLLSALQIPHTWKVKDGQSVEQMQFLISLKGNARDIFAAERTLLNLLGRMSGIATVAHILTQKLRAADLQTVLTPTRKTLWGLVDKRACFIGGAGVHRLNLADAILIKHPHLKASGLTLEQYLTKTLLTARKLKPRFVEVEVGNARDAYTAAAVFAHALANGLRVPCVILFDNMSPSQIRASVKNIRADFAAKSLILEASGGITGKNLLAYAKTGVDVISMGALTNGSGVLDISLRLVD